MEYRYEKCNENNTCIVLPCEMAGQPLTVIGAKAFLSCRQVEKLVLPDTLVQVEDWAFAHMKGLIEIVFPAKEILFGKKVFLGCDALRRVTLIREGKLLQELYEGISFFLASAFRLALAKDHGKLYDLRLAGDAEGQWRWLAYYDEALLAYLMQADDNGFEPAFIGWFDVEDVDDQRVGYMSEQIRKKIELAFQRMVYAEKMSERTEKLLKEYLIKKAPEQVLELMRDTESGGGGQVRYFRVWRQIGGFELYSPKFLLEELENADPEVRSFLLECELEETVGDFFGSLEL
ncbi:MAG: leucine-rich repeat domain-containing protein [Acetatifactor sp.]|nr:leucine-rich repeat domain-containing protein [Acetatifactor sp.]